MVTLKWDRRFLDLAAHVAQWSKDPRTKVGAVVVDDRNRIVGMGFNGFPRGVCDDPDRYDDRDVKHRLVVHAELNAILNSPNPQLLRGSTLYVTHPPCGECAKAIIQAGIANLVVSKSSILESGAWAESVRMAGRLMGEAGIDQRIR